MAFQLFEQGRYQESWDLCREISGGTSDPAVSVLCATNLFHLGRLDEAEAHFRDLAVSLPGASHVHSYLGKVLEARGDSQAAAEYARAVILDPGNLEALRSYSSFLLAAGDFRKAIPVLRQLAGRSRRDEDTRMLARALGGAGMAGAALDLLEGSPFRTDHEFQELLIACGRYREAAAASREAFMNSGDAGHAREYLRCLVKADPEQAAAEFPRVLGQIGDPALRLDYATFLRLQEEPGRGLDVLAPLLEAAGTSLPGDVRLEECRLLALAGRTREALAHYQALLWRELESLDDPALLAAILASFRSFLLTHYPVKEAESFFLKEIASQANVACLLAGAAFYEEIGDLVEARAWFYRAYRSDYLAGGLEYARFLFRAGDLRECEKVMLYVVNNLRKTCDLVRLAGVVMDEHQSLHRMPRFLERLRLRLEEKAGELSSDGLEYLALTCLVASSRALERSDFAACKEFCLEGLDVLPAGSRAIRPDDFLSILKSCKERSLCDVPVLQFPSRMEKSPETPRQEHDARVQTLDLDEKERKILEFLRDHRQASEMDLRTLLGSRRVVGIVNRIIQKAASQGMRVIEKKGISEQGEIYEYVRA